MFRGAAAVFIELSLWFLVLVLLLSLRPAHAATELPDAKLSANTAGKLNDFALIPRDTLFGNPQKAQARLSPDGKWLSFLAPVDGVLNVWVAPADDLSKAEAVTNEKKRPVTSRPVGHMTIAHILYPQDTNGNENFHIYRHRRRNSRNQGPDADRRRAAPKLKEISEKFPHEILVGLNDRDPAATTTSGG